MPLNDLHIRHFHDTGYLKVPHVLTPGTCSRLVSIIEEEIDRVRPPSGKVYRFLQRSLATAGDLLTNQTLLDVLTSLLGPNVVCVTNRHNHATLGNAGQAPFRYHRDILQPTRGLVSAVFYLRDATLANGCTHLIPGSHRLPSVGVPQSDGGGTWMDEHEVYAGFGDQGVPIPARAGDVLLFDALAFHTPGTNSTDQTRPSITLGFRAVDELSRHLGPGDEILITGSNLYRGNH